MEHVELERLHTILSHHTPTRVIENNIVEVRFLSMIPYKKLMRQNKLCSILLGKK